MCIYSLYKAEWELCQQHAVNSIIKSKFHEFNFRSPATVTEKLSLHRILACATFTAHWMNNGAFQDAIVSIFISALKTGIVFAER